MYDGSFEMFEEMLYTNNYEIIKILCRINIKNNPSSSMNTENTKVTTNSKKNMDQNISRNSLCPCGSGKKYKRCCGKLA